MRTIEFRVWDEDLKTMRYLNTSHDFICFDEDRGGYYPFATGDGCGCCEEYVFPPYSCEVIGNIYDKEVSNE